jgi:hypothetical protein
LEPFSRFESIEMQNPANQNTFSYINNFLCVPFEKADEVARVNNQLKSYFNGSV